MKKIITISREFGSGGRLIGKLTAEKLGIAFYDKDLIELIANESGLAADYIKDIDEILSARVPLNFSVGNIFSYTAFSTETMSLQDHIHIILGNIINDIAEREACVIVGRCADYILRGREDCLNVFVHAATDSKLERITKEYNVPEKNALKEMEKIDKSRAGYYKYYSGQAWGLARNYHLSLNSSAFGLENCVKIITDMAEY
ncbi:MAG: cytidylate kinase-like family protein [Clostridiales Family XIII bacterium]|jgi:cytidylate kinase|nr:cytidylate kinase-like family protein [Clostridiales Family XIII bacterium]